MNSPSKPVGRFQNQVVVIVGASGGLGAAVATAFAREGAQTVLFARSADHLETVAARCRESGPAPTIVAGDITDEDACQKLMTETVTRHERIDVVVVSSGIGMWSPFAELETTAPLREVMRVNYNGLTQVTFHALPHLRKSGGQLVVISSIQGKIGAPCHTGYSASKHAAEGFCKALRMELRGSGVNILTILPHWFQGTRFRANALGADGHPRGASSSRHHAKAVTVDEVAQGVLRTVLKRKRSLFIPWWLRLLALLSELAPVFAERLISSRVKRESNRRGHSD